MAGLFTFSSFAQFPTLQHGVATAEFGNMSFNWGDYQSVRKNRKQFFAALGVPENRVVVASLLHETTVFDAIMADGGSGIVEPGDSVEADILVTAEPGTFLFMVVADCLALFLLEPEKQVCALVHAGWRGVEADAPRVAIRYLHEQYGCDPANLWVGMSPAIQADSFRFPSKDVEQHQMANWKPYLKTENGMTAIDFVQYAFDQMVATGIPKKQIENSGTDTKTDQRFYSHRRSVEQKLPEARFGCLIGFKNTGLTH